MKKKITAFLICLLIILSMTGCTLPFLGTSESQGGFVIAGGNTSERQILSEVQKQMVNHYMPDKKVSIINNLGSTVLVVQTFTNNICNMAGAMYTGTSLTGELNEQPQTDSKKALAMVQKGYKEKFNMKWYESYGFENTYAFMVRKDFAQKHNLKTVSDLKKIAGKLRAGVDTAWMRRKGDGYEAFKEKYGFDFKKVYPMEIGLVYEAVKNDEMDVVLGYSTDGRISSYDLVLLEDDRHVFPAYDVSPVVNYDLLEKYPELDKIMQKLEGTIDSKKMQELNRISDEELVEPQNVAKRFLEENNYFEDKEPIVVKGQVNS